MGYAKTKPESVHAQIAAMITDAEFFTLKPHGITEDDWRCWFRNAEFSTTNGITEIRTTDYRAEEIAKRFWQQLTAAYGHNWRCVGLAGNRASHAKQNPIFGPARHDRKHPAAVRQQIVNAIGELDYLIRTEPTPRTNPQGRRGMHQFDLRQIYPALHSLGCAIVKSLDDRTA